MSEEQWVWWLSLEAKDIPDKAKIKIIKRSLRYIKDLPISNCFDVNEGKAQTHSKQKLYREVIWCNIIPLKKKKRL